MNAPFKVIEIKCKKCGMVFISTVSYFWAPMWRLELAYYSCPKCDHYDEAEYYTVINN
jgi:uncharacterized C2H2 Zn-finger protein